MLQGFHVDLPVPLTVAIGNGGDAMHDVAFYGTRPVGYSVTSALVWGTPTSHYEACSPYNASVVSTWPASPILIVNRGGCSYHKMVQNAYVAGAIALVIVDNLGLCGVSPGCLSCVYHASNQCTASPGCSCQLPTVPSFGSVLGDISIPVYTVNRDNGTAITNVLSARSSVVVTLSYDTPIPSINNVTWELWSSSWDTNAIQLKSDFAPLAAALGSSVNFTPRYFVYNGTTYGCNLSPGLCGNQCLPGGLYCEFTPSYSNVSGADVVAENLRELCIWSAQSGAWWQYVNQFQQLCGGASDFSLECAFKVMYQVGIASNMVMACINGSWFGNLTGKNCLLQDEITRRTDLAIVDLPTVVVNDVVLKGVPTAATIFTDICDAFPVGNKPAACACQGSSLAMINACIKQLTSSNSKVTISSLRH